MIIPTTTIEVTNQSEDIVVKVKEQFNVNYEIKKIQYSRGFPDGYEFCEGKVSFRHATKIQELHRLWDKLCTTADTYESY